MKLKLINTIVLGASLLLSAVSFTSCCDDNDWDVDGNYDRMFHTTSLSVDAKDDRVGVIFDKVPGAISYQVEINRDTLYDDIELNANGNSIIQELTTRSTISKEQPNISYVCALWAKTER